MTYRLSARFYDLFGLKNDLEFYRELALRSGHMALELGVGTARVAIPLARVGVTVVGIDNSPHMLEVARAKLAKEAEDVTRRVILKKGDMKSFALKQRFPFIYIPSSTFDHNVTVEEQEQTLQCIRRHLEKGGVFAFDLEQVPPNKSESSWWIDRKEAEGGKTIVRSIFTRRDRARHKCSLNLFFDVYKNGKLLERYHEFGEVAAITKDEMVRRLEETGFEVINTYGNFDKSRYQKTSSKIVLVTKRK